MRRYWEAHDLILKAMSTTDGPFYWEGEFFHYSNVNIWPRSLQQLRAERCGNEAERLSGSKENNALAVASSDSASV
jgi:hypothetical protein